MDLMEIIKDNDVQNVILSHVNPDAEWDNEKSWKKLKYKSINKMFRININNVVNKSAYTKERT